MGSWPAGSWETTSENFILVVLDFRRLLFVRKEEGTLKKPYFEMFMNMFVTIDFSIVTKPPVWLWICGTKRRSLWHVTLQGMPYSLPITSKNNTHMNPPGLSAYRTCWPYTRMLGLSSAYSSLSGRLTRKNSTFLLSFTNQTLFCTTSLASTRNWSTESKQ